jgi:6-phosphogluconolactonase
MNGLVAAIEARGRADFCTTGGSSAIGVYRALSDPPQRGAVDWSRVHIWWGDDRYVPRDHPLSNVQPLDAVLLETSAYTGQSMSGETGVDIALGLEPGVQVPAANVHAFPCGEAIAHARGPQWCAEQYAVQLAAAPLRIERGFPVFDVVYVGLGPDGHLLSVFPGSEAFDRSDWALAIPAPTHVEPHVARVTLNPAIFGVARSVIVVTTGAGKAEIVGLIFDSKRDPREVPAELLRRTGATWILDSASAQLLPQRLVPA